MCTEWPWRRYSVVMKFGGSSVADAARMREVANIVLAFQEEMPIVVLSAMGGAVHVEPGFTPCNAPSGLPLVTRMR